MTRTSSNSLVEEIIFHPPVLDDPSPETSLYPYFDRNSSRPLLQLSASLSSIHLVCSDEVSLKSKPVASIEFFELKAEAMLEVDKVRMSGQLKGAEMRNLQKSPSLIVSSVIPAEVISDVLAGGWQEAPLAPQVDESESSLVKIEATYKLKHDDDTLDHSPPLSPTVRVSTASADTTADTAEAQFKGEENFARDAKQTAPLTINLKFHNIYVNWDPEGMVDLKAYQNAIAVALTSFGANFKTSGSVSQILPTSVDPVLFCHCDFGCFILTLNKLVDSQVQGLLHFTTHDFGLDYVQYSDASLFCNGRIGTSRVLDARPLCTTKFKYVQLVKWSELSFKTHQPMLLDVLYSSWLEVALEGRTELVYFQERWNEIADYVNQGMLGALALANSLGQAAPQHLLYVPSYMTVRLNHPLVRVPPSNLISERDRGRKGRDPSFLCDLGAINVTYVSTAAEDKSSKSHYDVNIEDVKVSCVHFTDTNQTVHSESIIKPITLHVSSNQFFPSLPRPPEYKTTISSSKISASFSPQHIALINRVWIENIWYPGHVVAPVADPGRVVYHFNDPNAVLPIQELVMQLSELHLHLRTASTKHISPYVMPPSSPFCKLNIATIDYLYRSEVNGSSSSKLRVRKLKLDDNRAPDSTVFRTITGVGQAAEDELILDMLIEPKQSNGSQGQKIDLEMRNFFVIALPSFLKSAAMYATHLNRCIPEVIDQPLVDQLELLWAQQKAEKEGFKKDMDCKLSTVVHSKLSKLRILLVKDETRVDSPALVLGSEMLELSGSWLHVARKDPETENPRSEKKWISRLENFTLSDFHIHCCAADHIPERAESSLLPHCSLSCSAQSEVVWFDRFLDAKNFRTTQVNRSAQVNAMGFNWQVSHRDIELLFTIYNAFNSSQSDREETTVPLETKELTLANERVMYGEEPIVEEKVAQTPVVPAGEIKEPERKEIISEFRHEQFTLQFSASVALNDDLMPTAIIPLVHARILNGLLKAENRAARGESNLAATATCDMELSFFNQQSVSWQSVIPYVPITFSMPRMRHIAEVRPTPSKREIEAKLEFSPMCVQISHEFLVQSIAAFKRWNEIKSASTSPHGEIRHHQFILHNLLGGAIFYSVSSEPSSNNEELKLAANDSIPLILSRTDQMNAHHLFLSMRLGELWFYNIPISKVDNFVRGPVHPCDKCTYVGEPAFGRDGSVLLDNNENTYWDPVGDWSAVFRFPTTTCVSRIVLQQRGDWLHDAEIVELQRSQTLGGPFTPVAHFTLHARTMKPQSFDFHPQNGLYWRLVVKKTHSGNHPCLRTMQMFGPSPAVYVNVSLLGASKIVELNSGLVLSNCTKVDMDIRAVLPNGTLLELGVVQPKGKVALPVELAINGWSTLEFRPSHCNFPWSQGAKREALQNVTESIPVKCQNEDMVFLLHLVASRTDQGHLLVSLHPPLVLCNLFPCTVRYKAVLSPQGGRTLFEGTIEPGEDANLHALHSSRTGFMMFQVSNYGWSPPISAALESSRIQVDVQSIRGDRLLPFFLRVDKTRWNCRFELSCKFWINDRTGLDLAITVGDCVFQNQRYIPVWGWGSPSLPTDRSEYTDEKGDDVPSINRPLPSTHWKWLSEWSVDVRPGITDNEGWEYALDFRGPYSPIDSGSTFVRRRRKVRLRGLLSLPVGVGSNAITPLVMDLAEVPAESVVRLFHRSQTVAHWSLSKEFSLGKSLQDFLCVVQVPDKGTATGVRDFDVAVQMDMGPGQFHHTTMVSFFPRYLIYNALHRDILIEEVKDAACTHHPEPVHVLARTQQSFFRHDSRNPKPTVTIRLLPPGIAWRRSRPIPLDEPGEFSICIREDNNGGAEAQLLVHVTIEIKRASFHIRIQPEHLETPIFRIVNHTAHAFQFRQKFILTNANQDKEKEFSWSTLHPRMATPYAWQDPSVDTRLLSIKMYDAAFDARFEQTFDHRFYFNEFGQALLAPKGKANSYRAYLKVVGLARELHICKEEGENEIVYVEDTEQVRTRFECIFQSTVFLFIDQESNVPFMLGIDGLKLSQASLQLPGPTYVMDRKAAGEESPGTKLELRMQKLQIDANIPDSQPCVCLVTDKPEAKLDACLSILIQKRANSTASLECIQLLKVHAMPVNVSIDENLLRHAFRLGDAILTQASVSSFSNMPPVNVKYLVDFALRDSSVVSSSLVATKSSEVTIYEHVMISRIKVRLAFIHIRDFRSKGDRRADPYARFLKATVGNIPTTTIENGRLFFEPKYVQDSFNRHFDLLSKLLDVYMNELIEQAFRLVLSTEMLGNPAGLFSHLSRGMHTFVNEPIDSLEKGEFPPLDFVVGVTKGTGGLVSAAVSGIGATASGLARTGGNNLARLTMDKTYQAERAEQLRRDRVDGFADGVFKGAKHVGLGVINGVTGVVTKPIAGAKKDKWFEGMMKGVGKGAIGLVVKPITGVVDGVSKVSEGLKGKNARQIQTQECKLLRTVTYKEASQQRAPTVSDMTPYRHRVTEEKTTQPLLEARNVSDLPYAAHKYSSVWNSDAVGTGRAQGQISSQKAWIAGFNDFKQWLQFDTHIAFGRPIPITGVVTMGRADFDQWVSVFEVVYSDDEKLWMSMGVFEGNRNRDQMNFTIFPSIALPRTPPRFIRICPLEWHNHISMRASLLTQFT